MKSNLLGQFPAGWCYPVASDEERDRLHVVIAELLADEITEGLPATAQLEEIIRATRAIEVRQWLDNVRSQLRAMVEAETYLNANLPADVARDQARADKAAADAEKALLAAQQKYDDATARQTAAEQRAKQLNAAKKTLESSDRIVLAGYRRLKKGRP